MTPRERLVTAPAGTDPKTAEKILQKHRIEKLLLVDAEGRLVGLVTAKDILKRSLFPNACKDAEGRLRVAAAVGVASGHGAARASAGGSRRGCAGGGFGARPFGKCDRTWCKLLRKEFPKVDLVAGNVVTAEAAAGAGGRGRRRGEGRCGTGFDLHDAGRGRAWACRR